MQVPRSWEPETDSNGGTSEGSDYGWVNNLQGPGTEPPEPDPLGEALDSSLTFTTGGDSKWGSSMAYEAYYDGDAARSGDIDDDEESWMQTTYTASAGDKVSFFWKVSSVESSNDELKFYIDDSLQNSISGEKDWEKKSYSLSAGSRTLKWVYAKDSATSEGDDCGWVDGLYVGPASGSLDPEPPGDYAEAVDSSLKFTTIADDDDVWTTDSGFDSEYYYDGDAVRSGSNLDDGHESCLQTIVESDSSETLKFWWKVSSNENDDYLEFYIDDVLQSGRISGEVDWTEKEYSISAGIHTLKWRYVRSYEDAEGDNCGWVDFVQWTGASPVPDSENWEQLDYKYDVYGRRSEKLIDGYATRYVYDGPHVIAEYDGNNNLLRKFIYGPGIDQPVSMIEEADSETYYYHYDALGSVIALSDSSGDTVQTYEYSVYGEVYVEDANHTNPYMFAGRRYDIEIGLYYNRARYYNPYTGRFLQTDPLGYGDGMNMYAYCGSSPLNFTDPSGLLRVAFYDPTYENYNPDKYEDTPGLMREWADDTYFDRSYPMYDRNSVLYVLERLKKTGYDVTEVFFFDHAWGREQYFSNEVDMYAIEFGHELVSFDQAQGASWSEMEGFAKTWLEILGPGVEYHFRNCLLGSNSNIDRIEALATWTQGTLTGAGGLIHDRQYNPNLGISNDLWIYNYNVPNTDDLIDVDIPDYGCWYQQAVYDSGTVTVSPYWRPVVPDPPPGYLIYHLTY